MIKAIFFDWGGVLTEGSQKAGIINFLKETYNITVDPKVMGPLMDKMDQNKATFKEHVKEFNTIHHSNLTIQQMKEAYKKGIHPNTKMIEYIKNLKSYQIFILSNNNATTKSILEEEHKEMLNLFQKVYLSHELDMHKPNADIFTYALKENNLQPKECIFVDDKQENIDAAKKVGMKGIVFKNAKRFYEEISLKTEYFP